MPVAQAQVSNQQKIQQAALEVYRTPAGKLLLDYLKATKINTIMGPASTDAQLRQREGERQVVAEIFQLIEEGEEHAKSLVAAGTDAGAQSDAKPRARTRARTGSRARTNPRSKPKS